jgi:hypothetical protein
MPNTSNYSVVPSGVEESLEIKSKHASTEPALSKVEGLDMTKQQAS